MKNATKKIETLEQADAIVLALAAEWAEMTDGQGPQFAEMGSGRRIAAVRNEIARATSDDERAFAIRHYCSTVTDQRDHTNRTAAPRGF